MIAEWGLYYQMYDPSRPITEQKFDHMIADLSSDLGPLSIAGAKGSIEFNTQN